MKPESDARFALTPGEPAGIGPDITVQLAATGDLPAGLTVIADPDLLAGRAEQLGLSVNIAEYDPARPPPADTLEVLPVALRRRIDAGSPVLENAAYVLETLDIACGRCLEGRFAGLITGPLHKGIINEAGTRFSGHTEYLAERCGVEQTVMLLTDGQLRVALATTHLPLREVAVALSVESLKQILRIMHRDLQQHFGLGSPRIAVLGLNPHAGEGGHLGHEETRIIEPVIRLLRDEGLVLSGPLPADTAFTPAARGEYDAVLAMYHDQGLPALKAFGFGHTVNITLGLPIIRTSVDHGTALDIAGSGRADPGSLLCAITFARQMAERQSAAST